MKTAKLNQKLLFLFQIFQLFFFLYLFLLSIDLMGSSLKLFGKEFAEMLIANTTNPIVGLFIGILATSLTQSSSSTTSIVVGMVGGNVLTVHTAIPIIMGANIGTSVTNTIVALAHLRRTNEFRRSFAASIVHDFFNILAVLVIFPLQFYTNFLGRISSYMADKFQNLGGLELLNPVKAITKPVVDQLIVWVGDYPWILLLVAVLLLFIALNRIVGLLREVVVKRAEIWFNKYLFKTQFRAFMVGWLITLAAQSSSITTSLVIPMAGAGILTIKQIFPYTLGANLGTTVTAILASLLTGNINALIVAFAHLWFNIFGTLIWWPLKKIPIWLAEKMAQFALQNKLIPIFYIIIVFILIPTLAIILFR